VRLEHHAGAVPAAFRSLPRDIKETYGPEVTELCTMVGYKPDPEQAEALDALFAINSEGKCSAFEFANICCRQNMKTGLLKMAVLGWLFITDQRLIIWTAHEMKTTKEAFRDLENLIMGSPILAKHVLAIHRANGDEAIELKSGQRVIFKARTSGGGRGLTGDKIVLDEAYALKADHMGALIPALSATPDPQVLYASSAGKPESEVLRSLRDRGRAFATNASLAYFEWCAPEDSCESLDCNHDKISKPQGCALDNRDFWRMANPAIGRRISEQTIANERDALPEEEFARERLGWWDDPGEGEPVLPGRAWSECQAPESKPDGKVYIGLDVSPTRSWASLGAAAASSLGDERIHIEVTGTDTQVDHREGVGWVVPRLTEMLARNSDITVAIAAGAAAESLVPDLTKAGIPVEIIPAKDVTAACGLFYDLAMANKLAHLGQETLTTALVGARRRELENAWLYARRKSAADITPLYAVTIAAWLAKAASDETHFYRWDEL
jgi:hypothetical protein